MSSTFSTRPVHIFFACFLTLQLCLRQASAQFSRDTVFTLALTAVTPATYPALKLPEPTTFFLQDSFSVLHTKKWMAGKPVSPNNLTAAIALGNNYFSDITRLLKAHNLPPSYTWIPL